MEITDGFPLDSLFFKWKETAKLIGEYNVDLIIDIARLRKEYISNFRYKYYNKDAPFRYDLAFSDLDKIWCSLPENISSSLETHLKDELAKYSTMLKNGHYLNAEFIPKYNELKTDLKYLYSNE